MALLRSGTLVLGGRLLQLATAAILALLLPRLMPASEVGTYFLAQVAITFGATIAQGGLTFVVPGAVGEALAQGDRRRAGAICRAALVLWLAGAAVVGAGALLIAAAWPGPIGASLGFDPPTLAVVVGIAALVALCAVVAEMHRARGGIAVASLLPNAQGVAATGFGVAVFLLAARTDAAALLVASLGGAAAAALIALPLLQRHLDLRAPSGDPRARPRHLAGLAWPALATSVAAVVVALADQSIAGVVGGTVDAAHYGLGLRLAALLALPLSIVNVTLTPRVVALWTADDRVGLQRLLTRTVRLTCAAAGLGLAGLAVLRVVGMGAIWGDAYAPALTVALALGVGQALQACGGSGGHVLMLLGHQRAVMQVALVTGAAAIAAGAGAMAWRGPIALAVVMATANAAQTLAHAVLARRRLGLATWLRPTPA